MREIYEYIRKDSPEGALRVVRGIYQKARLLVDFPQIGHLHEPRKYPNVRVLLYGHYRIVYSIAVTGEVYILGVFHGSLDLRRHLQLK